MVEMAQDMNPLSKFTFPIRAQFTLLYEPNRKLVTHDNFETINLARTHLVKETPA
jgi:hypothetical protein